MGGGEGGWEPIRRHQVSERLYKQVDQRGRTGTKKMPRQDGNKKQETGQEAKWPGTGWLNACKSGRSGRMSRMPPLLPYPPCPLLAHAGQGPRWCGSYADITLSREWKGGWLMGRRGVQQRGRRVHARNQCDLPARWMHQGTTCTPALLHPPIPRQSRHSEEPKQASRPREDASEGTSSVISPPGRASATMPSAPQATRIVN